MGPTKKEKDEKDIVLVPTESDFTCELDEGCTEVTSNDKTFEMNFDFREFARTDIKVTITKSLIKIFGFSETEFDTNEFDEDIAIPPRVKRDTINCIFNKQGVLRLSAPIQFEKSEAVQGKTIKEMVTTTTKEVQSSIKTTATQNIGKVTDQPQQKQDGNKKTLLKKDDDGNTIIPSPQKINFAIDEKQIKDKVEFILGSIKNRLEAYMKVAQYSPEDITVKVMKLSPRILRFEGRRESKLEKRSFMKEIVLPANTSPENINVAMNDSGILRVTIEPKEEEAVQPQIEPPKQQLVQTSKKHHHNKDGIAIKPKKTKFECTAEEIKNSLEKKVSFKEVNEKTVQVLVNVSEYTFEEIHITRIKRTIHIEASKSSSNKTSTQNKESSALPTDKITQPEPETEPEPEFHRQVEIPESVDAEHISCEINGGGIIKFEGNIFVRNMVKALEEGNKGAAKHGKLITLNAKIESVASAAEPTTPSTGKGQAQIKTLVLEADGSYQASITAQGYLPEEIEIFINHGLITIKGKKKARSFGFSDNAFRTRSFSKKIQIPPQIKDFESVVFELASTSGMLFITAPAVK